MRGSTTIAFAMALTWFPNIISAEPRPKEWNEFVEQVKSPIISKDFNSRIYFAAQITDFDPTSYQDQYPHWAYEQPVGTVKDHYVFSIAKDDPLAYQFSSDESESIISHAAYKRSVMKSNSDIKDIVLLPPKRLFKKMPVPPTDSAFQLIDEVEKEQNIHDPGFFKQWHLVNPLQLGNDLNITGVWSQNITGKSVAVAVVDDGLDMDHEDLAQNYFAEGSWDFNDNGPEPKPKLIDDRHGTRCCGEIAAARNDKCGVGVAYDANIAGIRILSGQLTESDEAISLNYAMDKNDIYSCSWGPQDNGKTMEAPGMLVKRAFLNGVQNGRDKKGSLFVFASGNGAAHGDNCNFDGYTNSIYSITVAAIDRRNEHPFYSEQCSANMVVTYSSNKADHIYTTDVGHQCTDQHGGTSAAAPIAAGVFALVLDVRPDLTWRDVQYLAWESAVQVNEDEDGWQVTPAGKKFHHKYGYGKLDAYRIVERAKTWELVKPQAWLFSDEVTVNQPINYSEDKKGGGVLSTITVTEDQIKRANFESLEHVNVHINVDHKYRGALTVLLESPQGIVSELAAPRPQDASQEGYNDWKFMSVVHWGEKAAGDWKLHVFNDKKEDMNGTFKDWALNLWGQAEDASKAKLFSYDHPDDDDTEETPIASSTGLNEPSSTEKPTPSTTESATSSAEPPQATTPTSSSPTSPTTSETALPLEDTDEKEDAGSKYWGFIPTFGMSGRTLVWLYGSLVLIVIFVLGVGGYILIYKRKHGLGSFSRVPNTSTNEFELVPSGGFVDDFDVGDAFTDHDDDLNTASSDDEAHAGISDEQKRRRSDFYRGGGVGYLKEEKNDSDESPGGSTIGQMARSLYDKPKPSTSMGSDEDTESSTVLFAVDSDGEH